MTKLLRVGVIGLGRRWRQRYRPALLTLSRHFRVTAVCDPIAARAVREARRLRCEAVSGPTELLTSTAVEVVLLADTQWFRLWPLELACKLGKPVFCGSSLERDDAHADALLKQVQDSDLPVMMDLAPRFAPATTRLRELLQTELGPARLVTCDYLSACSRKADQPSVLLPELGLLGTAGVRLLDWGLSMLGSSPVSVLAREKASCGVASVLLELADGQAFHILRRLVRLSEATPLRSTVQLQVVAERGVATVRLPDQVCWTSSTGTYQHHDFRKKPGGKDLPLQLFHQAITTGQPPEPGFHDAHRILGWLRLAARSQAEGRRVDVTPR